MITKKLPILTHIRHLTNDVQSCNQCDISKYCDHKVVARVHNPKNKQSLDILFLGEAPGDSEYINKLPFIGPAGECLQSLISEAVDPDLTYIISNAIWCTPYDDSTKSKYHTPFLSEIAACSANVQRLIDISKSKLFVACGAIAEKSLKQLKLPHYCRIMHPSAIMQASKYQYEFDNAVMTIKQYISKHHGTSIS